MVPASSECVRDASENPDTRRVGSDEPGTEWIPVGRPAFFSIGGIQKLGIPVLMIPEGDGGYSVITPSLPGACAQGETLEDARTAILEVLADALKASQKRGEGIPFRHQRDFNENGDIWTVWLDA